MTTEPPAAARRRVVLLTGVGKPGQVGEAVAEAFAALGDHVVLVDRALPESRARAAAISAPGGASAYAADLADAVDVGRLAADIRRDLGDRLDAVVHMAGGWSPGQRIAESEPEHWERILSINLLTAVYTARSFAPLVRAARGTFVFFASEAALAGAPVGGMAAYAVAKQGVATMTRALAQEERVHGVRANALAPGAIRTASNESSMGAGTPFVERAEVAAAVVWLCSSAASAVSGQLIHLATHPARSG